ncbi:P-loop NTPase family protein [Haloarcula amylovorans]|uniref:hypothetical protein n=1 Tax=Haloarcula amylovorans TaxID=2562280 RepID=UPI0010764E29|nr:hypothetical protein [Halomicroarcula amylolytica]
MTGCSPSRVSTRIPGTEVSRGPFQASEARIRYLAATIFFLRHVALRSEIRNATGVLKKRRSEFERTLWEFRITAYGLKIGSPLDGIRDVTEPDIDRPEEADLTYEVAKATGREVAATDDD